MVDDHRFARLADLIADGGRDLELAARDEAEGDLVEDAADDPAVLGDAGDSGEAHAGDAAHDVEDGGNGADAGYRIDIVLEVVRHGNPAQREAAR